MVMKINIDDNNCKLASDILGPVWIFSIAVNLFVFDEI